jgi:hypothetical protein
MKIIEQLKTDIKTVLNEWKKYENCSIRYYNQSDSLRLLIKRNLKIKLRKV